MQRLNWAEIIRLRDKEGLTFEQIGQRMGKAKATIRNAYVRAKAEESKPEIYQESKLKGLLPELEEIVSWWRERKQVLSKPTGVPEKPTGVPEKPTGVPKKPTGVPKKPQTYILSRELTDGVRKYAERKGITLTEAINEVVRRGLIE